MPGLSGGLVMVPPAPGAVAAAIQAVRASGAIVNVLPDEFQRLLEQNVQGLLVHTQAKYFTRRHR